MSSPKEKPSAATEGSNNNITCPQGSDAAAASQPLAEKFWNDDETAEGYEPPEQLSSKEFDLLLPPGLVGEVAQYIYSSADYPMREGAIVAALGLIAGIVGRHFNFNGSGLNLYLLLLAESGRGKESMAKGIDRLVSAAREKVPMVDEFVGPGAFASGQGLIRTLDKQPSFFSIQGEFGEMLRRMNSPRAPDALVRLKQAMLDLYGKSGWGSTLGSTAYSDMEKNTTVVAAPAFTLVAESVPGKVLDHLSFDDIEDGFLPRFLPFESRGPRGRANKSAGHSPSPGLVDELATLAEDSLNLRRNNRCVDVLATEDAALTLQHYRDKIDDLFDDKGKEPHERVLFNRAPLNVMRVAALVAIGCTNARTDTPLVDKGHVEWAIQLVEYCVDVLASRFRAGEVGTGGTRQEAELKKYIIEYLRMSVSGRLKYKVPKKLVTDRVHVGLDYLRRRARRCKAFTQDVRGFDRALSDAVVVLVRTGALRKADSRKFGMSGEVYHLHDLDALKP
ncbi:MULTISPECIES: DUF3987 domain-containing protein [unclassified Rhodanobacter]|uniref:DUF3987 domain-containing protein n=1 Tax=unclassified Rhodanobacter TaxID=2621553 RepID=UPI001BDFD8B5|nr:MULTISPECIES: DUF3987 domain-containing protein [unclassified Rhodanobacter]MBT2145041.1 hypothetical protein [Rhodanobacter sp. LX-99]MBT2149086.1 hypothetical protein [Rhodanobacter sp. LX-100]